MALTITPGGASDDAYYSLASVKAYWDDIGFVYSSYSDTEIEQAIRRATKWIDAEFGDRFQGERTSGRDQALEWPRTSVIDRDGNEVSSTAIPIEVEWATAEAAKREVAGTSLSVDTTAGRIATRETVGPITVEYAASASVSQQQPTIPIIEGILSALFSVGRGSKFLRRA